jgi:hypothetical protein
MRVTPDTGILVRMNAKATGPTRRLLDLILDGPHEIILSEFLLNETARVLYVKRDLILVYIPGWFAAVLRVRRLPFGPQKASVNVTDLSAFPRSIGQLRNRNFTLAKNITVELAPIVARRIIVVKRPYAYYQPKAA